MVDAGNAPPAVHVRPFVEYALAVPPLATATNRKLPYAILDHVADVGNAPVATQLAPLSKL